MAYTPMLPATAKRPPAQRNRASEWASLNAALSDHYSFTLWLLIGGSLQALLALTFRSNKYAYLPIPLLLSLRLLDTLAIILKLKPNPYLRDAHLQRVAPQIPDGDGTFDATNAGNSKVVVFLLGFKINHPLGILAPEIGQINTANVGLWRELEATAPESGYYGSSEWTSRDAQGAVEILTISYWRSTEDVHRFAYGPSHRRIWEHWNKVSKERKVDHLGISHEIFEVDRHMWEGVYLNFQPTLLGATSFLRKGDTFVGGTVDDVWVSGLMDASKGKLRTSAGRLGREPGELEGRYGGVAEGDGKVY